jgi:hypothetical protein
MEYNVCMDHNNITCINSGVMAYGSGGLWEEPLCGDKIGLEGG